MLPQAEYLQGGIPGQRRRPGPDKQIRPAAVNPPDGCHRGQVRPDLEEAPDPAGGREVEGRERGEDRERPRRAPRGHRLGSARLDGCLQRQQVLGDVGVFPGQVDLRPSPVGPEVLDAHRLGRGQQTGAHRVQHQHRDGQGGGSDDKDDERMLHAGARSGHGIGSRVWNRPRIR